MLKINYLLTYLHVFLRRLSGHLCRKKDSTFAVRAFAWLVAFLVCVAIGLAYTGFQSRGGGEEVSFISFLRDDLRVTRTVLVMRETNRTAEGYKSPGNRIPSPEKVSLNKVPGDSPSGLSAGDRDHGKKPIESILDAHETSRNSKTEDIHGFGVDSVNFHSKPVLPPLLKKSKDDWLIADEQSFGDGVASAGETSTTTAKKFDCPSNFTMTDPDNIWFQTAIAQKSQKHDVTNDDDDDDDVVILTPISNVRRHLWKYFENVCSLTYPHRRISIVLGEDSSTDRTFETAEQLAAEVRPYFKRVEVLRLKGSSSRTSGHERHDRSWQLTRRRHLAMARNQLMVAALGGGSGDKWVLWMDSDVRHIPRDLVERMIWPGKGIVAANCLYRMDGGARTDTFDRNTWRDTEASKRRLRGMPEEFLMLEGYDPTERKTLNDLKGEGDVVRLDGVGGCALFVEADLHRKGLVFPAFVFDHHVETEGLAKMAARLGLEIYGLPSVNVIHW